MTVQHVTNPSTKPSTKPLTNTAFFISHEASKDAVSCGHAWLKKLAARYDIAVHSHRFGNMLITLVGDEAPRQDEAGQCSFSIGRLDKHKNNDRFLDIKLGKDFVSVTNDYAGAIPVFYSWRNGLTLSNIEPAVFRASDGNAGDLSPENIFAFLKFSHFIWDETAWQHIFQTLPDSETVFDLRKGTQTSSNLQTVKSRSDFVNLPDNEVADALYELNRALVFASLEDAAEIILPLSSGYDSRLVFAALSERPDLRARTKTFTYGSKGWIDVHAARDLAGAVGLPWAHIDLPCNFLKKDRLCEIGDIFGASLHMHGMYQLEFWDEICRQHEISEAAVFTSGFMSGAPAGQNTALLLANDEHSVWADMERSFCQSRVWSDEGLKSLPLFCGKDAFDLAEQRLRKAVDWFDGEKHQKAVMLNIWTRQRNFISYYPRSHEWHLPIHSPHMHADYVNFFMSISADMLLNRRAVELMFKRRYPQMANIVSDSNGFFSLGSPVEKSKFFAAKVFGKLGLSALVPENYRGQAFDFDRRAMRSAQKEGLYPLLETDILDNRFLSGFGGAEMMRSNYQQFLAGDNRAYEKMITIQALALTTVLAASDA